MKKTIKFILGCVLSSASVSVPSFLFTDYKTTFLRLDIVEVIFMVMGMLVWAILVTVFWMWIFELERKEDSK